MRATADAVAEPALAPLLSSLRAACQAALDTLEPGPSCEGIAEVLAELDQPLRVAVAGRVSSGKSTLVNALVGEQLAETRYEECTRLVFWFRYGPEPLIQVHPHEGAPQTVPFDRGDTLPASYGLAPEEIDRVEVVLPLEPLRRLTILDTPGTEGSVEHGAQARRAVVGERDRLALGSAESLLYVIKGDAREDDRAFLDEFRASMPSLSAANSLAVLNQVDTIHNDEHRADHPWGKAWELAASKHRALSTVVAGVVPVVALIAETAETHRLSYADVDALAQMARVVRSDETLGDRLFLSARLFASLPIPGIDPGSRERLFRLLGLYGTAQAMEVVAGGLRTVPGIERHLLACSGLPALREHLEVHLASSTVAIKAAGAIDRLEVLSYRARREGAWNKAQLEKLRDDLAELRERPPLDRLALSRALQLVAEGSFRIEEQWIGELYALANGGSPGARVGLDGDASLGEVAARARELQARWHQSRGTLAGDFDRVAGYAVIGFGQVAELAEGRGTL